MSKSEITKLTRLWRRLTAALDFHAKKWHVFERAVWREATLSEVHDLLFELGVGEPPDFDEGKRVPDVERDGIVKQFIYRDGDAHARTYGDVKRAQLRFGF